MKIQRVVITGASGPLGVMMTKGCIERNIEVIAITRYGSAKLNDIPRHPLVTICEIDITNIDEIDVDSYGPADAFFHFAWMHTSDGNRDNPILQARNIDATLKAAECAKKMGCKAFIATGSQAEYGLLNCIANEDSPTDPITMYGITKLAAGKLVMEQCRRLNIRCNWIRIFSVFGPYENDYVFTSYIIRTLLHGEEPALTPCEQVWDYLYCKDAIKAMLLVAEKAPSSGVYCLGSGDARPLSEYVKTIRDCIDNNLTLGIGKKEYSPNQIMYLEADISKLRNDVGFVPEYTFEEGIKETVEWYKYSALH